MACPPHRMEIAGTMNHTENDQAHHAPQPAICLIYSTFPSQERAEAAAREMVAGKLVACANILPGMVSFYEWEGVIEHGEEVVMLLKTTQDAAPDVIANLAALHPYEVPAIITLPLTGGLPAYLHWVAGAVAPAGTP